MEVNVGSNRYNVTLESKPFHIKLVSPSSPTPVVCADAAENIAAIAYMLAAATIRKINCLMLLRKHNPLRISERH
jgi:hypothetical protein